MVKTLMSKVLLDKGLLFQISLHLEEEDSDAFLSFLNGQMNYLAVAFITDHEGKKSP